MPLLKHAPTLRIWRQVPADATCVTVLLVLTAVVSYVYLHFDNWLARTDLLGFFVPWYGFLGERLRAFDVPGWNPHVLGGTPFAGDPQSGWMYLPAMLVFPFLPVTAAFKTYAVVQLLLAGLSTYALARVLGMRPPASLVAAAAYEFGPFLYRNANCCTIENQVAAWIPMSLLSIELALRSRTWLGRAASWSLAGLAISQMLAGWIGQGAYNGLLMVGGYVAYRTLLSPPDVSLVFRRRIGQLVLHGAAVLVIGFGLGAAGVLPRLDVNERTNLAGGEYERVEPPREGWDPDYLAATLMAYTEPVSSRFYLGGATIALAILAPLVARRRYATPYFALLCAAVMIMALDTTALHRLLYLLPRYQALHEHAAARILGVMLIGVAMLAGATVDSLARWPRRPWSIALAILPVAGIAAVLRILNGRGFPSGDAPLFAAGMVGLVLVAVAVLGMPRIQERLPGMTKLAGLAPILLLGAILWEPTGRVVVASLDGWNGSRPASVENLSTHPQLQTAIDVNTATTDPGGAGEFLQQQADRSAAPFRYFGYDGERLRTRRTGGETYHQGRRLPEIQMLLVVARAMGLDLYDVQGYDPVQLARYVEYVRALNDGVELNYHDAVVLPAGVDSPLLDLLNVRYIVVPIQPDAPDSARADLDYLESTHDQAFANDRVRVLGNDDALPRAWVVHDARQVARGEALPLLASRAVDPRRTALLEVAPPPLAQPSNPATDSVAFDRYEPDRLRLTVQTEAAGLVVVSEVYDPGWHAYVDGERTPLYVADHVLRAVAVPAGTHTVEMRYEPRSLRVGIAISVVFAVAVLVVFGAAAWRANQRPAHLMPALNTPARTPGRPGGYRLRAVGTLWRRESRRRPG